MNKMFVIIKNLYSEYTFEFLFLLLLLIIVLPIGILLGNMTIDVFFKN